MHYRVLTPEEATPLLLDPNIAPIVAVDTEFDPDAPYPGRLIGASMAGGSPETGFFGCFWSFDEEYQRINYRQWHEDVLLPIVGDPNRTLVCHPLNVEMPQFFARGLRDEDIKCSLEDTIAQAYIYDDNLPHGLKELAYCILLKHGATTYKQTQAEIEGIRKQANGVIKDVTQLIWECYKEERKKSTELEVEIDPTWPGWKQLAMSLPPKMVRSTPKKWTCGGKKGCGQENRVDTEELGLGADCISVQAKCEACGKRRKLTHGVEQHVIPIVSPIIRQDYNQRAQDRFELYGAEDAIYTLMIRYHFMPTFTPLQLEHLDMETRITHPICTRMQQRGLKVDIDLLSNIHWSMSVALEAVRADVLARWSLPTDEEPFNPASNDQLAQRLWVDWALNPPAWAKERGGGIKKKYRRNKDGLCKADALILETMERAYRGTPYGEAIKRLQELRRWEKLFGTYVDVMLTMARKDPDGRIHSSFWPTGARSGRFSCVAGWTELYTDAGECPIRDISVGDNVWTHEERWRPVLAKIVKGVDHMYDVRLSNGEVLTCTDSHRFLTSRMEWVTLGEIREHFKDVDIGCEEYSQNAEALPGEEAAHHRADRGQTRDHASQHRACAEAKHARGRAQDAGEATLLGSEVGRQAPHEGEDRSGASQLDRGVRGRERLSDRHAQREASLRASSSHGGSIGAGRATEVVGSASHRRQQEEQQSRQLGAGHAQGARRYSLFAGRGLPCVEVEEVNYRGRCKVYDIAVADDESYQAAGVFSHNSSDPNVENIPRPFTMPALEVKWAMRIFADYGYNDPHNPPPGFIPTNSYGKRVKPGEDPTHWRVESLREIFISPKGWVFVSADLSQIENRLTGYESRDPTLLGLYTQWDCFECKASGHHPTILHACPNCGCSDENGKRDKQHPDQPVISGFVHGKDIHSATAAALNYFEKYGPDARQQAKPVNHASTYGMGPATFAKRNDVPVKQAEEDMNLWHGTYPGVKGNLHARAGRDALVIGEAKMFDGHIRRFHAQRLLKLSGNFKPWEWEGTIREYVNVLAQGGTGVIMKRAMLAIDAEIERRGWRGKVFLVNQVHDELLYECVEELRDEVYAVLVYHLENSAPELDVPVLAEGGTGFTWGAAH